MPDKNHQAVNTVVNLRDFCSIFNDTNIVESESDVAVLNKPDLFDYLNKDVQLKNIIIYSTQFTHSSCQSVEQVIATQHFVIKLCNPHNIKTGFRVFCIIKIHIENISPRGILCRSGLKPAKIYLKKIEHT